MKRLAAAGLLACALMAQASEERLRPEETRAEQMAAERVRSALVAKDCARAAAALNDGLAARHPGLFLIAGTMYEEGLCLKPNWERAQLYYQRALEAGHRGGLFRLVAGLADGPRDVAAALWWAQRALASALPADCRVPDEIHRVPESYVATLRVWPQGRLPACVHTAGVLAMITGDVMYPPEALDLQLAGTVRMVFLPAEGRIDWTTTETDAPAPVGVVSGEWVRDRQSREARDTLRRSLEEAGRRALKRYPAPPAIDPAWRAQVEYRFTLQTNLR